MRQTVATCVLVGVAGLLLGLAGRLVYINTSLRPQLLRIVAQQRRGHRTLPARRGMILDTRGRVVAVSRRMPDVFVDPSRVKDVAGLARELSARIDVEPEQIETRIGRSPNSRHVVLATAVDAATAEAVRTMGHPAVHLATQEVRTYPIGAAMTHVLGFVGRDGSGLEGIELWYDDHLRGQDGRQSVTVDGRRRALWPADGVTQPPIDGGHVVLTIDAEIQRIAESALEGAVDQYEAESGVIIVMSPSDGEVLAMACRPTYDPAHASTASAAVRRNRAVTDPVEPGSAFKPFIVCGALAGGFVNSTELIDCHRGSCRFGRRTIRDTSPHGLLDLRGIITYSSNVGMALIGERMGNAALYETIRGFGFGERTGIDFPGESSGLVYPLKRWTSYSAVSVVIGYELSVTPLQLITAFCAILNDGILLRPRLVKRLHGPNGEVVKDFSSRLHVRRVVSRDLARYVARDLLVSVVERGTGRRAQVDGYSVLGKTGTAKLPYLDRRGYEPGAYSATFIGAAPANDPRIAVLITIRRPNARKGYYGSRVAAPAAGRILAATLDYLGIPRNDEPHLAGL